jgi:hypothetical protein
VKSDTSTVAGTYPIQDDFNFHDASFRRHFQLNYSSRPHQYETFYAPAYRYGYLLSTENPNVAWKEIEAQAQDHWAAQHPVSWQDVVDAVRYGWTEKRQPSTLQVRHPGQFEDYEPAFRQHLANSLLGFGASFENYEPVYRYGYTLAIDPANRTYFWSDMEPQVRAMWEQDYQDRFLWEDFRDVVRHAWQEVRNGAEQRIAQ